MEYLHHRSELQELREDLHRECERNARFAAYDVRSTELQAARDESMVTGIRSHLSAGPASFSLARAAARHGGLETDPDAQTASDPVWQAAKSQSLGLMPRAEIEIYAEIDAVIVDGKRTDEIWVDAQYFLPEGASYDRAASTMDISALSVPGRRKLLESSLKFQRATLGRLSNAKTLDRAVTAVLNGATTVEQVQAAELGDTTPWKDSPSHAVK